MQHFLNIMLLIAGFLFLVKGADFFVAASSSIARRFKVSSLVIGLTLVAFGTSLPELAVSFIAALTVEAGQTADIALGNVVGSNIANIALILGLTAITRPVVVSRTMYRKEFPYLVFSTFLLVLLAFFFQDNASIVRWEAIVLLLCFSGYIVLMIRTSKDDGVTGEHSTMGMKKSVLLVILGIAGVTLGGWMVTSGARNIATDMLVTMFGVDPSKAVTLVGLSVVAVGTSLPEMVTSVVAARKGENEIAFGNLIGSNIFNMLFILGLSGTVTTLGINKDVLFDLLVMSGITLLALAAAVSRGKVSKKEGVVLVSIYGIYLVFIIVRALELL
jgi:cation:H+ antiporter